MYSRACVSCSSAVESTRTGRARSKNIPVHVCMCAFVRVCTVIRVDMGAGCGEAHGNEGSSHKVARTIVQLTDCIYSQMCEEFPLLRMFYRTGTMYVK